MYLWKCWRDTRSFFTVFLVIAAAAMPATAAVAVGAHFVDGFGASAFLPTLHLLLFAVSLGLGTLVAIEQFSEATVHFLLTKPRTRAYFVWAAWGVGCAELLAVALANLSTGWLTLGYYGEADTVDTQQVAGILVYAFVAYALAYSWTAALRSGLGGIGAAMGTIMAAQASSGAAKALWNVTLPTPPMAIAGLPAPISDALWMILAVLFVAAAQHVVARAEV
jgi:hypothetical protein